jgi:hypothetical protein
MHPQGVLTPATTLACLLARRSCCRGALVACTVQLQRHQLHAQKTRRVHVAMRQRTRELRTRKNHRGVSRSLQIHVR